jgi:hypothetical protein
MRHRKRLDRLAKSLHGIAADRARRVSYRCCVGLTTEELSNALAATLTEETVGLFEELIQQAAHYMEHGRRNRDGSLDPHGFLRWMWRYLPLGWSSLPTKMPAPLLTSWVKGYIPEFGGSKEPISPQPCIRCESCYLVHPNRNANGEWGGPNACAACGGTDLSGQQYFDMRLFSRDGGITRFQGDAWTREPAGR